MSESRLALLISALALIVSLSPRGRADTPVSALPATCVSGDKVWLTATNTDYWCESGTWTAHAVSGGGGGAVPTGAIVMVDSGSCPTGYTEDTALSGNYVLGTTTALGGVGTSGGSTSYTPAGTVAAPTLTMNSYTPAGTNGTVSFTPAGSNSAPTFTGTAENWTLLGKASGSATNFSGPNPYTPAGTVSAPTFTGTAGTVPAEAFAGTAAILTGTNSAPAFAGTAATIQPPFTKVLFCKAP